MAWGMFTLNHHRDKLFARARRLHLLQRFFTEKVLIHIHKSAK